MFSRWVQHAAGAIALAAALPCGATEAPSFCTAPAATVAAASQERLLQEQFALVLAARQVSGPVALVVTPCTASARSLEGTVLVPPQLAQLPVGEQLFTLAHEVGHLDLGHFEQLPRFASAGSVATLLEKQALLHRFEFEADQYARRLVGRLGLDGVREGERTIGRYPVATSTLTHPSTMSRIEQLRAQAVLEEAASRALKPAD